MARFSQDISSRFYKITSIHRKMGEEMSALLSRHEMLFNHSMSLSRRFLRINDHYFKKLEDDGLMGQACVDIEKQMEETRAYAQKLAFTEIDGFIPANKSRLIEVMTFEKRIAKAFSRLMQQPERQEQLSIIEELEAEQVIARHEFIQAKVDLTKRLNELSAIEAFLDHKEKQQPIESDLPE